MLTENDVVSAVCVYLESRGYRVAQRLTTSQRGHDIVALREGDPTFELHVEAKGETSNRSSSARYGTGFNNAQVRIHIAEALYKAISMLQEGASTPCRVGIALPDSRLHEMYLARIRRALEVLEVAVFWVAPDHRVRVEAPWHV